MGITRKPCKCCKVKCCALNSSSVLPFTPDAGWTTESITISNSGTQECVGRAVADIVLSKPSLSTATCGVNVGCGTSCRNGFRNNWEYFEVDNPTMFAKLTEWVNAFTPFVPAGWIRTDRGVGGFQSYYSVGSPAPTCTTWRWRSMQAEGADVLCAGECAHATTGRASFFTYEATDPAERYHSTQASRDALMLAKEVEFKAACDAWWASSNNPSIKWTIGTCEYEMTPNRGGPPIRRPTFVRCAKYVPTNPPSQRWIFCGLQMYDFNQTAALFLQGTFTILCAQNPCTMADYNWPTSIPCNCQSHYLDSDLTTAPPPPCTLHLMSTRREFSGDKCYFIARYGGAIEAGVITCPPATTDPTCICCSEPP